MMIQTQQPYHLAYLKTLKPLNQGQFDNELLNDGYHRVLLSRMTKADGAECDHEVRIETNRDGTWTEYKKYPASTAPGYCTPDNSGISSQPRQVGNKIAKIMDALGLLNHLTRGGLDQECDAFRMRIWNNLQAEGWRVSFTSDGKRHKVLPPIAGKRNDA